MIGDNRWFLESSTGEDEVYGDFAVPLEMDDEERGEFTEWILYRDGEVVTTVTEDEIDSENDPYAGVSTATLTNPIGSNLKTGASGFVLSTLASMVGLLGRGDDQDAGRSSAAPSGDSGTGFRMFGSIFGLKDTSGEEDTTWALWDVNRDRPAPTLPDPGDQQPAADKYVGDKAGPLRADSGAVSTIGDVASPAGEDEHWVAVR